jgi:hypothetical protein
MATDIAQAPAQASTQAFVSPTDGTAPVDQSLHGHHRHPHVIKEVRGPDGQFHPVAENGVGVGHHPGSQEKGPHGTHLVKEVRGPDGQFHPVADVAENGAGHGPHGPHGRHDNQPKKDPHAWSAALPVATKPEQDHTIDGKPMPPKHLAIGHAPVDLSNASTWVKPDAKSEAVDPQRMAQLKTPEMQKAIEEVWAQAKAAAGGMATAGVTAAPGAHPAPDGPAAAVSVASSKGQATTVVR